MWALKTTAAIFALGVLAVAAPLIAYADTSFETREQKVHRFGTEAEQVYYELQTTKDEVRKLYLEKRLEEIIGVMNSLGIPTQEQADENPEYWILRSYHAQKEASQNPVTSVMYNFVQSAGGGAAMQFRLGYAYPCYWLFECTVNSNSPAFVSEGQAAQRSIDVSSSHS